jgi:hypothetical protein
MYPFPNPFWSHVLTPPSASCRHPLSAEATLTHPLLFPLSAEAKRGKVSHWKFKILYIHHVDPANMTKFKKFDFEKIRSLLSQID